MLLSFPEKSDLPPLFDILNILSPQSCQITFALINIRYLAAIFFVTRPKPPYGRQGLAGLWGKDEVWQLQFSLPASCAQLKLDIVDKV